jgi:hypothetical protein
VKGTSFRAEVGLLGSYLTIKRESYLQLSENEEGSRDALKLTRESYVDITHWEL